MSRGTRAQISQSALRHNFQRVQYYAPNAKVWAVVKANGYGHGATLVATTLGDADGFAVSTIAEGIALRNDGIRQPIILLEGVTDSSHLAVASDYDLICVVHCDEQLRQIVSFQNTPTLTVWLKIDTGMHRLGFSTGDVARARQLLATLPNVTLAGVMTHFACADNPLQRKVTEQQLLLFLSQTLVNDCTSIANSAAIITDQNWHGDWVRPGIMLYGASPLADKTAADLDLKAAMTFVSPVIALHKVRQGDSIGYGLRWQAVRDSLIATLAVGYGDGYPRHAPDGTPVWLNGEIVPLAGRVSMDMIMVDVTDLTCVSVGDIAELWGQNLPVDLVAQHIGTIGYELVTRLSPRVEHELVV